MSEWWSYRLSDFLMFSPRTYWRLVENYNRDLWPAQLMAMGAGLVLLYLSAAQRPRARRAAAALLGLAWLWVGWAFHWQRYATINWAAAYLALAFAVQAMLLAIWALVPLAGHAQPANTIRNFGWVLEVAALLYPLMAWVSGRPWTQAEVFGLMPEPTALATLGFLLGSGHLLARWLSIVPALSLLIGAATLWLLSR
jgi:Family of unknown function (DUF6064)